MEMRTLARLLLGKEDINMEITILEVEAKFRGGEVQIISIPS